MQLSGVEELDWLLMFFAGQEITINYRRILKKRGPNISNAYMPGVHPSFRNCGFRDLAVLLHSRFDVKAMSRERALRRKNRKSSNAKSFLAIMQEDSFNLYIDKGIYTLLNKKAIFLRRKLGK